MEVIGSLTPPQEWSRRLGYVVQIVLLILVLLVLALKARAALFTNLRKLPGPWYAPWTNLILKLHVIKGTRLQYIHALHTKYGPVVRISPDEVSISDLESQRTIHRVGSPFLKSEWYQKLNPGPPGVFAMVDPKQHATRRRLFAQAFSNSNMLTLEPIIKERIRTAVSKIRRDALAGNADVLKWFTFLATDISGELSFGKSFEMLQQEQKTPYIQDLEVAVMISGICIELGFLVNIASILPIASIQHALATPLRVNAYGHQAIQNLRNHSTSPEAGKEGSVCIFSKMIDETKNSGLSDYEIEHEAANLIVAGSDTTANSLTYLVWVLLHPQHREIRNKLEAEFDSLPPDPTSAQLATLPYFNAVLKEGLRLYCAAPGSLPRIVPAGGTMLAGYHFPGGATVSTHAYTLHRDPRIFTDPETFNPDRWLNPSRDMLDAFTPFGAGSRTCLGIHLAMMELQLTIYTFMKECKGARLASTTTDESMEIENYFLITPKSHRCEIWM